MSTYDMAYQIVTPYNIDIGDTQKSIYKEELK